MGIGDSGRKVAEKAKEAVGQDKVKDGIDKAGEKADGATGGKHTSQVDKGREAANEGVDNLDD